MTLEIVMSRVALRDQAAFRQLYEDTSRCLFGIAVRMLRERPWAEEVLQEIYVSIWNTAPSYSAAKAQPMTWLMAVARNKTLDALRSRRSERACMVQPTLDHADDDGDGAPLPDIADEGAGPLQQLCDATQAKRLRHCLHELAAAQRQAIALAFYDGMTHTELAAHLHQPLGTVKAWVRRGLERLKPCLERSAASAGPPVG
ncbi:MAG: sigma-70 family RNA polymerase sigma factor [Chitinophagaceae bacterium]|nr:sigma-70 family RNA polymerase sigma factor [Rubrivivax sp.]